MSEYPAHAFWIAHVSIHDEVTYAAYRIGAAQAVFAHGGRFVARGGRFRQMEGAQREWNTVAVFPNFDAALACYHSAAYQSALAVAKGAATRELVIVEGVVESTTNEQV